MNGHFVCCFYVLSTLIQSWNGRDCVCIASWKTLYIETLKELDILSMVKQVNKEILRANVCQHCKDFYYRYCWRASYRTGLSLCWNGWTWDISYRLIFIFICLLNLVLSLILKIYCCITAAPVIRSFMVSLRLTHCQLSSSFAFSHYWWCMVKQVMLIQRRFAVVGTFLVERSKGCDSCFNFIHKIFCLWCVLWGIRYSYTINWLYKSSWFPTIVFFNFLVELHKADFQQ